MPGRSSTTTLRHSWEKADVLCEIAVRSERRAQVAHGQRTIAMSAVQRQWKFTPHATLHKIDELRDEKLKVELRNAYKNAEGVSFGNTHDFSNPKTTPVTYKGYTFVQGAIVVTAFHPMLHRLRNPYVESIPPPRGRGQIANIFLDSPEILSCLCKLNYMASAAIDGVRMSPFQLVCRLARDAGVKLVKNHGWERFCPEDPSSWTLSFDSWGHISKDNWRDEILNERDSPIASFGRVALNLTVTWHIQGVAAHGPIKDLLMILVDAHFLELVANREPTELIDETIDACFLPPTK